MPITDDRTAHLNLPKPYADNMLEADSDRIRTAFDGFDTAIYGKQAVIGYTPENVAMKGAANGYAALGSDSKVPAGQLPSFVDDVLEYATFGGLPVTGETGKIYVVIATNKTYRWSGSVYTEIASSPGSTDVVSEGSVNKYFTDARALAAVPIASPTVLGKVKVGAGLGIDGAGLLFASAGGGSVMSLVDVTPGSNGVSSITVPSGYVVGAILVAFNGSLLSPSDYTAATGTTIGLVGFTAGTADTFTIISLATVSIGTLPASSVTTTQLAPGAVTPAKTTGIALSGVLSSSGITGAAASGANTDITSLNAPALGAATAATQTSTDSSTKVATTAFVKSVAGITLGTTVAATSGTSIDFTGIPSTAKRVTILLNGVSLNANAELVVQLGTSGGIQTTGYAGMIGSRGSEGGFTTYFAVSFSLTAALAFNAVIDLSHMGSNVWVERSVGAGSISLGPSQGSGNVTLGSVLDRVRITSVSGTAVFDAGSVNILVEN